MKKGLCPSLSAVGIHPLDIDPVLYGTLSAFLSAYAVYLSARDDANKTVAGLASPMQQHTKGSKQSAAAARGNWRPCQRPPLPQPLPHFALSELISHLRFTALSSGQGNFLSRPDRVVNFLLALHHFSL
jgi:hypothetical protein